VAVDDLLLRSTVTTATILNIVTPQSPCTRRRRWSSQGHWLALALLVAPLWMFSHFPSTDGGAHVANADVLLHYHDSAGSAYRQYYQASYRPIPNCLGHLILCGLLLMFSPAMADKIVASACVITLPLSLRYAAAALGRRGRQNAALAGYLALPLAISYLLHQGFYNFCLSLSVFFLTIAFWLRHQERLTAGRTVTLAALVLLLYLAHLFSLTMACLTIGTIACLLTALDLASWNRQGGWVGLWRKIASRFVISGLAFLPALALSATFKFAERPPLLGGHVFRSKAFWSDLLQLGVLISYRAREHYVSMAMALLLLGMGIIVVAHRLRLWQRCGRLSLRRWDILLPLPALMLFLYFSHGDEASIKVFMPRRLMMYLCLMLVFWLSAQRLADGFRRFCQATAISIAVALSLLHCISYAQFNTQLDEFLAAAGLIEPGTTILPLVFSPRGLPAAADSDRLTVAPFYQAAGFTAAEKHAVDLRNYEGQFDYFPVRFQTRIDPFRFLARDARGENGLDQCIPQRFDLPAYERQTGGRADYVLIWAVPGQLKTHPDTLETYRQLGLGYQKVFQSTDGLVELWKKEH